MRFSTHLIYTAVGVSLLLTATILVAPLSITNGLKILQSAQAQEFAVEFDTTDEPGSWFKNISQEFPPELNIKTQSLAVVNEGDTVKFTVGGSTNTVHTVTSLLWPSGAADFPVDSGAFKGRSEYITLSDAGLYVFVCKLHPYMLAAVIADDSTTPEFDLGQDSSLVMGGSIPTASDLALRLVRAFFVITTPENWQDHSGDGTWDPSYAKVPVLAYDYNNIARSIPDLDAFLGGPSGYFVEPVALDTVPDPLVPGVGEVWIDTQYELTEGKTKPGTATKVDVENWDIARKVALPGINMNNPHNMWTDQKQKLIYQTQWFDNKLTTFDRETGKLKANIVVGEAPAHVMTRVDTEAVHVSINGGDTVAEVKPNGKKVIRQIPISLPGDDDPMPHAHWMSFDGQTMVTPNANTADSTIYHFGDDTFSKVAVGNLPIATGMMPDASKYYVSNFLDSTISVVNLKEPTNPGDPDVGEVTSTINLLQNYHNPDGLRVPFCTEFAVPCTSITGPVGALPIQTPVSPDGKYVVTANTLTNTITIIDTSSDTLIQSLACDAGCHGVNFGAKQGGGYYAYVSSKFANTMLVVDMDTLSIVGRIVLDDTATTATDDVIVHDDAYRGMGGQGVLPIPLVYNGWVQNLPEKWQDKLTDEQLDPLGEEEENENDGNNENDD
jgi:DNA-binding beta-propeller fold protein YncE